MNAFHPLTLAAPALLMFLAWAISVPTRNAAVADLFWGPALAASGLAAYLIHPGPTGRGLLVLGLAWAWALRLSLYLFLRNRGKGEDSRYAAMRKAHPRNFPLWSLVMVFGLQSLLAWIIAWPLRAAIGPAGSWNLFDLFGAALSGLGLALEALADGQLATFKSDPRNKGKVMDRGLWRYSRHPNYFGESLVWWGFGFLALAAGSPWALLGSALITFLLLRVSGVPMLEQLLRKRGPAYADYIRRTSAFIPWPPQWGKEKR